MSRRDELVGLRRREFLQVAGSVATTLAVTTNARGQNARPNAAAAPRRPTVPPDRGLWATWYDLPVEGRESYLNWLHATYLPELLKRPGYLWAAHYASREREGGGGAQIQHTTDPKVGTGFRYILLVGATDADVFGTPTPSAINAALPDAGRKMIAMRVGERVNILTETGRCEGRAAGTYDGRIVGAPCIQIGSFNCPVEYEEEMHAGYVASRMPAHCATASCVRTRKLNSVAGWAKHVILYEYMSLDGFTRDYEAANSKSPLGVGGHSIVPYLVHAPFGPNSALRLWPPVEVSRTG
jgi:hypothetical protein